MTDVRIGFVGAGNWALGRARRFAGVEGCRVTVGWSRSGASRARFQRETGAPTVDDWQAVCESDTVDAVAVCVPHVFHYERARAALDAGKHVFVETPLCLACDEANDLAQRAEHASLVIHHAAKWRYHPDHGQQIANLRAAGPLVYAERFQAFDGGPDRPWYRDPALSGGPFSFLSYAAVDFFEAFGRVDEACGERIAMPGLDVATMQVRFTGGGQARISYGIADATPDVGAGFVIGREGVVQLEGGQPVRLVKDGKSRDLPGLGQTDVVEAECQAFVDEVCGRRDHRPELALDLHILDAVTRAQRHSQGNTQAPKETT